MYDIKTGLNVLDYFHCSFTQGENSTQVSQPNLTSFGTILIKEEELRKIALSLDTFRTTSRCQSTHWAQNLRLYVSAKNMQLENTTCAHTSDTFKNSGIFIKKDVLPSCHERGTRKSKGIESQAFGFCALSLNLWASIINSVDNTKLHMFICDTRPVFCWNQQFRKRHGHLLNIPDWMKSHLAILEGVGIVRSLT